MNQHSEQAAGAARVTILTLTLAAGSIVTLLTLASHNAARPAGPIAFIALTLACCAAETFPVHFAVGEEKHTISFNELPLAIGVVMLTPAALVMAVVVGSGIALVLHRRQRGVKLAFNLAQLAVQALVALTVFDAIRHGTLTSAVTYAAIGLAVLMADTVSAILVSSAIALHRGDTSGVINARAMLGGALECLPKAVLAVGAVAAVMNHNTFGLIAAIMLSAVAYHAYRNHIARRRIAQPLVPAI